MNNFNMTDRKITIVNTVGLEIESLKKKVDRLERANKWRAWRNRNRRRAR